MNSILGFFLLTFSLLSCLGQLWRFFGYFAHCLLSFSVISFEFFPYLVWVTPKVEPESMALVLAVNLEGDPRSGGSRVAGEGAWGRSEGEARNEEEPFRGH